MLDGLEELKIYVGYQYEDGSDAGSPTHADDFEGLIPVYESIYPVGMSLLSVRSL